MSEFCGHRECLDRAVARAMRAAVRDGLAPPTATSHAYRALAVVCRHMVSCNACRVSGSACPAGAGLYEVYAGAYEDWQRRQRRLRLRRRRRHCGGGRR
jgi:hypothetical protein